MDLLFSYSQNKKHRNSQTHSYCDLKLHKFDNLIHYIAEFCLIYNRNGVIKTMSINHGLTVDLDNGDLLCDYQFLNNPFGDKPASLVKVKKIKNKFDMIVELTSGGFYRGETSKNFWGVKYNKATTQIFNLFLKNLSPNIKSEFLKGKDYINKPVVNPLFDLLVDFHLDKKKIKSHDSVYLLIQHEYPKIKWLKLNEYKFLPSILDSYGIKTKYMVGEINKHGTNDINIKSVSYLCKLFGEKYVDYLRQINWATHCGKSTATKKYHELKNEHEKKSMIKLINNWKKENSHDNHLINLINELLTIREFLETKNINLNFNAKNNTEFELIFERWKNMELHYKKGYRIRYSMPNDFVCEIEKEIIVDGLVFKPTILKTEEEYNLEGFIMKNCMSKQFIYGLMRIYISLTHKRKRINLQYNRNGNLLQSYGKANTPVDAFFNDAVEILNKKMSKYSDIEWTKEKYDFIN